MPAPPFRVEVYDKNFAMRGPIGNPIFTTIIPKWMSPGTATIAVPATHPRVADLVQPGARIWFKTGDTGAHLLSGWVARYRVSGPERQSVFEFDVVDDFVILQRILGWVVPSAPITGQGTAGTNWELTGPAETVFLNALKVNAVDRLGLPIQIPTTQGRGLATKARLRFQTLYDRLIPVEDGAGIVNSGIGIGIRQRTGAPGLTVDVWTPRTITQPINEQSGVVESWSVNQENATATRAVAGGQGEGQLRLFRERIDAALEAAFGWKMEVFRDARDTNDPTTMYARLDETLAEASGTSGMSVDFSETANFAVRPGKIWVGDQVTMSIAGVTVTERLQEATLSSTAGDGFLTRPRIGDKSDDPDRKLGTLINRIARSIRSRNTET
jgi:hypothetical protein